MSFLTLYVLYSLSPCSRWQGCLTGTAGMDSLVLAEHLEPKEHLELIDGKEGVIGPPGMDGRNVFPSPHEASGRDGKDDAVGPPDRDGKDGLPGLSEASGAPRTPGIDGRDGAMGLPGWNGRDGANGRDGRDGAVGPPGPSAGLDLAEIRDFVKLVVIKESQNYTLPPVALCPEWSADSLPTTAVPSLTATL